VDSVVSVFAGQPFNDRFTYRRDVEIERTVENWQKSDEELYMGFAKNPDLQTVPTRFCFYQIGLCI
jgi:type III restriction enzyme